MSLWFKVDVDFFERFQALNLDAKSIGIHLRLHALCKRLSSDGFVANPALKERGVTAALRRKMAEAGLWEEHPDGGVIVKDYLDLNPSRAQEEKARKDTAERVRNHRRNTKSNADVTPLQGDTVTPLHERYLTRAHEEQNRSERETDQIPPVGPPEGDKPPKAKSRRKKPEVDRPEDWCWTESQLEFCREHGLDPEHQAAKFKSTHDSKGKRFVDWSKAGWTWLYNAVEFGGNRSGNGAGGRGVEPDPEARRRIRNRLLEEAERGEKGQRAMAWARSKRDLRGLADLLEAGKNPADYPDLGPRQRGQPQDGLPGLLAGKVVASG